MTDSFTDRLASALATRYELQRELTGGGMSRVFVANEIALGRAVVVKVLPPDLAAGVNAERFRREIQLAAQLQHPHIVPLLSAGLHEDLLYYTMPFIEGESLRHRIERDGALPVRDVVRILHDVVEALAYAHERGVIHRDIKPGNILTLGPHALVTDFGVAKALSAALPHSGTTSAGMVVGSPAYMAPEQLAGDPSADHRVDLYAAGLLAYELLSGSSPFTGSTPQETMAAQLTRTPEPLHQVRHDVPPELSAVIEQALQKAPERRHATAREMLTDLERVSTPHGAVLAGAPSGRSDPLGRGTRFAAVLGVAGAIGLAALLMTRGRDAPPAAPDSAREALAEVPPVDSVLTLGDTTSPAPISGERAPVVLSYEDSVAISEAIQRRTRTPGPVNAESLKVAFQRVISDSAVRAAAAIARQIEGVHAEVWEQLDPDMIVAPQIAPPTDRPRLVVADFVDGTPAQTLGPVGRALADSLRVRFARESDLEVVDAARTRTVLSRVRNPAAAGWTLRADLMVTGHLMSTGDGVAIQVLATDLRRGRVYHTVSESVPPGEALAAVPDLMRKLAPRVEEMATFIRTASRAPRSIRPPPVPQVNRPDNR